MQKCEECKEQISWSKIYQSLWWNYKPIRCYKCESIHKTTPASRFMFVSLTIVPMLIFGHFLSPFSNLIATLGVSLLIVLLGSLLAPLLVTYKNR